ncbi:hypothetical protein TNCV_5079151 [Trichonephila clavipes]|nr:hypothetical protein TNCV_5079151 [Trichonephila clavipes]
MSRNVPNKENLVESSPGEEMELVFIPPTSLDHNCIEYIWDVLGNASSPSRNLQKFKALLLEKWALLPQILIDTLINKMVGCSEAYKAIHSGHTPY